MAERKANIDRNTLETQVSVAINLDGTHRKPEFPPENDTLDIYGIAPKEPEHPLNTESPDFQENYIP